MSHVKIEASLSARALYSSHSWRSLNWRATFCTSLRASRELVVCGSQSEKFYFFSIFTVGWPACPIGQEKLPIPITRRRKSNSLFYYCWLGPGSALLHLYQRFSFCLGSLTSRLTHFFKLRNEKRGESHSPTQEKRLDQGVRESCVYEAKSH